MSASLPRRIALHDYGCYPFIEELGRELRRRGYQLRYFYFAQNTTPQAAAADRAEPVLDPERIGLRLPNAFQKWSMVRRRRQEIAYGRLAAAAITAFAPDLVISANAPVDVQALIQAACRAQQVPVIVWLQDIVSLAMRRVLSRRLSLAGDLIGRYYARQERRLLQDAAAVIGIAPQFAATCADMGVAPDRLHLIPNWAPLSDSTPLPRRNAWSDQQGLSDKRVVLYAGTLGFKHDPEIFLRLADQLAGDDIRIVVISEGPGADWLRQRQREQPRPRLRVLPFQPYARLPEVLASADLLLAVLEPEAGQFSVPSKVLTYLASGRPLLLSVPLDNLAAATVIAADAGAVVAPEDRAGLLAMASGLLADSSARARLGAQGRAYAERHFAIGPIADRFEAIIRPLLPAGDPVPTAPGI